MSKTLLLISLGSLSVSGFPYILVSPHGYQSSVVIQLTKEIIFKKRIVNINKGTLN